MNIYVYIYIYIFVYLFIYYLNDMIQILSSYNQINDRTIAISFYHHWLFHIITQVIKSLFHTDFYCQSYRVNLKIKLSIQKIYKRFKNT